MIDYFSVTAGAAMLALNLKERFGGQTHLPRDLAMNCRRRQPFDRLADALPERFRAAGTDDTLICIMAAGIVFRLLGPHLGAKHEDPAVIVIDEQGRFVVPLLGGHAAGANELTRQIAEFTGGAAVVTTASDVLGLTAPDEVARRLNAAVDDPVALRQVTALLVDGQPVCVESAADPGIDCYRWVAPGGRAEGCAARLLITDKSGPAPADIPTAKLIPRSITAGVGCHSGTVAADIVAAIETVCARQGIDPRAVGVIASIDAKREEAGLIEAAGSLKAELAFFAAEALAPLNRPGSEFVATQVGVAAVSEPAALLAAGEGAELVAEKTVFERITVALARKKV